jgi:glucuronate isomerase
VNFTIQPLYSALFISSSAQGLKNMQNTALTEYLGVLTGFDIFENTSMEERLQKMWDLFGNKYHPKEILGNMALSARTWMEDLAAKVGMGLNW